MGGFTTRRAVWIGLAVLALILIGAVAIWAVRRPDPTAAVQLTVHSNPDGLVNEPRLRDVMGNYQTVLPIDKVPAPPGQRDVCSGRYAWAHSAQVGGIDAESTLFKIDIRAETHDALLDRAAAHFDNDKSPALTRTLLACPGGGGNLPPHVLGINLDTAEVAFFPDGGDSPANLNLSIKRGQVESILVIASAMNSYCKWRLELGFEVGNRTVAVTIGPDGSRAGTAVSNRGQRSFETTGDLHAGAYRFKAGRWQPGR